MLYLSPIVHRLLSLVIMQLCALSQIEGRRCARPGGPSIVLEKTETKHIIIVSVKRGEEQMFNVGPSYMTKLTPEYDAPETGVY